MCIHQAFRKFDELATGHTEKLRKLTKQVQEHRQSHDDEAVKRVVEEYDEMGLMHLHYRLGGF